MLRVALVQLGVGAKKTANVAKAVSFIKQATDKGAHLVVLPECFNSPYGTQYFAEYAETIPGDSTNAIAQAAKENAVHVVAGSIPERADDAIFNTCCVFDPSGKMVAKHRKVHLFDIDIPGKITFQESKVLTGGESGTMFDLNGTRVGVGICYDMRFAELALRYRKDDAKILVYPGAFNMTTGPAHWAKLQVARALDTQCFVLTASPARDTSATYHAYGHSMAVNPWGDVLVEAQEGEQLLFADLDFDLLKTTRENIPIWNQRKPECY